MFYCPQNKFWAFWPWKLIFSFFWSNLISREKITIGLKKSQIWTVSQNWNFHPMETLCILYFLSFRPSYMCRCCRSLGVLISWINLDFSPPSLDKKEAFHFQQESCQKECGITPTVISCANMFLGFLRRPVKKPTPTNALKVVGARGNRNLWLRSRVDQTINIIKITK